MSTHGKNVQAKAKKRAKARKRYAQQLGISRREVTPFGMRMRRMRNAELEAPYRKGKYANQIDY